MHSAAYIALPGGFGTLDELFEVLTLVQTRTVPPAPIVLIGTEFWSGLIDWIKVQLLKQRLIGPHDLELITITDDLDVVMQDIEEFCRHYAEERDAAPALRSEEHTSELQSLMRISYAVFCLKKKKKT